MKKSTNRAILIAAAFLSCHSAFGQAVTNNLYLGFENNAGGGKADYIINLGPANSLLGGSSVVNLSGDFSLADFTSAQLAGVNSSDILGGVVGGQNNDYVSTADVFLTQPRVGGPLGGAQIAPAFAGSSVTESNSVAVDDGAFDSLSQLDAPASGTGLLDTNTTWEAHVEPTLTAGTFWGETGYNPDTSISVGQVLYEDLWETSTSYKREPYTYLGYFTLDLSGATPSLTFTPPGAPAPNLAPTIASTAAAANTVTMIWNVVQTHTYQLQYATNLVSPNWANAGGSAVAGGITVTNSDSLTTGPVRFYRLKGQ